MISDISQSVAQGAPKVSQGAPTFFRHILNMATKEVSGDVESSRFGFTTAKNIMKQYQNYSNQTCGSNVMENILFMAAIFKNGSHFEFLGC